MVEAIELDMMSGDFFTFQDYGLDLDWLHLEVGGNIDYGVYFKDQNQPPEHKNDARRSELERDYHTIVRNKKKPTAEIISQEVTAMNNKGFMLRELIVHSGHGASREGNMFARILRTAHRTQGVPTKVEKNLAQGPRRATYGFDNNRR